MRAGVLSLEMPRTTYVVSFLLFATAIGHVLVSEPYQEPDLIYSPPATDQADQRSFGSATKRLYVSVIARPFTGSSALSGLLSTSPEIDCMQHAHTWQNEGTWLLTQRKVSDGGICPG
jgi:hypothetical protein